MIGSDVLVCIRERDVIFMGQKKYIITIDHDRCKGCDLCVSFCPKKVLSMSPKLNRRGQHYAQVTTPQACIGCIQCADICPDTAIEIDEETDPHA